MMEMVTSDTERVQGSKGVELLVVSRLKNTPLSVRLRITAKRAPQYTQMREGKGLRAWHRGLSSSRKRDRERERKELQTVREQSTRWR